jgi:hypothetical protein
MISQLLLTQRCTPQSRQLAVKDTVLAKLSTETTSV